MEYLTRWYDTLHPFFQNVVAAAFAISVWLIQAIGKKIKKSGSDFFVAYQKMDMFKHFIHKELVSSNQIELYAKGYL